MKTVKQLQDAVDPLLTRLRGLVRRMSVSAAGARAIWQFTGVRQMDGSTEARSAEVFSGVGIYAVPPSTGAPEAILVMVGDAKQPVAIAVRDERTRAAIAGELEADETALYNSQVIAIAKADGSFEVRSKLGVAGKLATHADMLAIRNVFNTWAPTGVVGDAQALKALLTALLGTGWPFGTTKLKGE